VILRMFARVMLAVFFTLSSTIFFHVYTAMGPKSQASPIIRPEFATQMERLRPTILAAAKRHNNPQYSQMSDEAFAITISQVLYNEHFGWLEEEIPPLQPFTPLYQKAQTIVNDFGGDYTVWPSNLRPSVAVELLQQELPIPGGTLSVPISISGSQIDPRQFHDQYQLYAAVNAEIVQPELAIEYLAANLARGVYRARYEGVAVTWQTLAAWHNQGIVRPADIAANPTVMHYLHRAAAYRQVAERFIGDTSPQP
jgi:hypothetical protein